MSFWCLNGVGAKHGNQECFSIRCLLKFKHMTSYTVVQIEFLVVKVIINFMIDNKFKLVSFVGQGMSSKVFLVRDWLNNKVALKIIRKENIPDLHKAKKMILNEWKALQMVQNHPNILNVNEINFDGIATLDWENEEISYLVLDYAEHGPLSNFIRITGGLEEDVARLIIMQLCNSVNFIHSWGLAHLDIKLENLLLDENFNAKVADFGSWVYVGDDNKHCDKRKGTLQYMAPEIKNIEKGDTYDAKKSDVYSIGVCIFVLLTGNFPSEEDLNTETESEEETNDGSIMTEPVYDENPSSKVSSSVYELFKSMVSANPKLRPDMEEVINSPWLTGPMTFSDRADYFHEMEWRRDYMLTYVQSQS